MTAYLRASSSANYAALTIKQGRTMTTTRSENEMLFTPSANETSGSVVFNIDAQNTYYLDNVQLFEADAIVTNPDDSIRFVINPDQVSKTISLDGNYVDVKNNRFSNTITLQPYESAVLISDAGVQNTSLISSNKPSNSINNSGTPVSSTVKLFPNPAGNTVFVSGKGLPQNKDFIISVISKNGAILKTIRSNTSNKAVEVNVSSLSAGVYTIKATAGFITINKQFVKQ
jgi:hypothetical protein